MGDSVEEVTVNEKGLVLIPAKIRKELGLKPGSKIVAALEGSRLVMWVKPQSFTDYMTGLHKEIWEGMDAERYIEGERNSWEDQPEKK